jgi:hypothetical protein
VPNIKNKASKWPRSVDKEVNYCEEGSTIARRHCDDFSFGGFGDASLVLLLFCSYSSSLPECGEFHGSGPIALLS